MGRSNSVIRLLAYSLAQLHKDLPNKTYFNVYLIFYLLPALLWSIFEPLNCVQTCFPIIGARQPSGLNYRLLLTAASPTWWLNETWPHKGFCLTNNCINNAQI